MHFIHKMDKVPYVAKEHDVLCYSIFDDKEYEEVKGLKNKEGKDEKFKQLLGKVLKILEERKKWANFLLPKTEVSLVLCHNDLNNLNIMETTSKQIYLIDYDYVGFNFISFDIANMIN